MDLVVAFSRAVAVEEVTEAEEEEVKEVAVEEVAEVVGRISRRATKMCASRGISSHHPREISLIETIGMV